MDTIRAEVDSVIESGFRLEFTIPTEEQLRVLRHTHRDRSAKDVATLEKTTASLSVFLEAVDRGEMDFFDLPPALRTRLAQLNPDMLGDDD